MLFSDRRLAGALAFIGAVEGFVGISLAEELYPGYSVSANPISDLGATCAGTCTIVEPASIVFTASVILLGGFVIAASYFINRATQRRLLTSFLFLTGIGAVGVGVFSETTGIVHGVFSLIVFLFGGLSAISSYQVEETPMNYLSILLGALTLAALVLYVSGNYLAIGQGGMERMVAFPALLWGVGFGAYLMKS